MNRRILMTVALACVCSLSLSQAFAGGPGCTGGKDAQAKAKGTCCAKTTACTADGFPTMSMMVGDKDFTCPMTAEKAAKEADAKVIYTVAGEKYECGQSAMTAYADLSEQYTWRFTTIAAKMNDQLVYLCDEKGAGACCASKASATCHASAEKAKAEGKSCHASGEAAKASDTKAADAGKGDSGSKGDTKTAAAGGKGTCCAKGANAMASCGDKMGGINCVKLDDGMVTKVKADCKEFYVLGQKFDSYDAAGKARDAALGETSKVKLAYLVDGKTVESADKVCPMAKKDGKVKYVLNGQEMDCEYMARVAVAKAQFEAAKKAAPTSNGKTMARM